MNEITKKETRNFSLLSSPISYPVKEYPVIDKNLFPEISAKGAVIMDRKSKVVLFSKNPELRFAPASTTKIMTALIAAEESSRDTLVTIRPADIAIEGDSGLRSSEQFRLRDILCFLILQVV